MLDITVQYSTNPLDLMHPGDNTRESFQLNRAARVAPLQGDFDASVVVYSAHEPAPTIIARHMYYRAVVVTSLPVEDNGTKLNAWRDFWCNLWDASFILLDHRTAKILLSHGCNDFEHKFIYIDGVQPLNAERGVGVRKLRAIPPRGLDFVAIANNAALTTAKANTAIQAAIHRGSEGATALQTVTDLTRVEGERTTVGLYMSTNIGPAQAEHLCRVVDFPVFPLSTYDTIGATLDCRLFHNNVDTILRITADMEGNAANQYSAEHSKVLLEELGDVIASVDAATSLRLPTSNVTLFDTLFNAMNIRGMRGV